MQQKPGVLAVSIRRSNTVTPRRRPTHGLPKALQEIEMRPAPEILPVIDAMVRANPHGVTTTSYSATLRKAAVNGGKLEFTVADLLVSVTPNSSPPSE